MTTIKGYKYEDWSTGVVHSRVSRSRGFVSMALSATIVNDVLNNKAIKSNLVPVHLNNEIDIRAFIIINQIRHELLLERRLKGNYETLRQLHTNYEICGSFAKKLSDWLDKNNGYVSIDLFNEVKSYYLGGIADTNPYNLTNYVHPVECYIYSYVEGEPFLFCAKNDNDIVNCYITVIKHIQALIEWRGDKYISLEYLSMIMKSPHLLHHAIATVAKHGGLRYSGCGHFIFLPYD